MYKHRTNRLRKRISIIISLISVTMAMSFGCFGTVDNSALMSRTGLIPSRVYAAEEMIATGKVTNDKLNVRTGPGKSYDTLGQLEEGDTVDITGTDGDWYRIEYDEDVGYVAARYIEIIEGDGVTEDDGDVTDEADSGDDKDKEQTDDSKDKESETEGSEFNPSFAMIIGAIILLLVVIIFATVKSIKNMSDDDYDDYDDDYDGYGEDYGYDDYGEDRYEDDYVTDEYADDGYEEDGYEEDGYEADDYAEEPVYDEPPRVKKVDLYPEEMAIEKATRAIRDGADPIRFMSNDPDDYRIDIDPSYFEKTGVLPSLEDVIEDTDAPNTTDAPVTPDAPNTTDAPVTPDTPATSDTATASDAAANPDAPEPLRDDPDAPQPIGTAAGEIQTAEEKTGDEDPDKDTTLEDLDREAKLDEALKLMEELKAEIEKIKNEQT